MKVIDLNGMWDGACIFPDESKFLYTATVPGSAIHDLYNAGRLPQDLFWRDNTDAVLEFECCDYIYKKYFDFSGEGKNVSLRFERIDTYADVILNGKKIYHSENGNIRHDIDVSDSILQGRNCVEVHLYSPTEWVKDMPERNGAFTTERMNTRRMQCTYGWDWTARFVTCGLGECSLLIHAEAEILPENVYITTVEADSESATVRVDITFPVAYSGRVFEFLLLDSDQTVACRISKYCKEDFVRLDFDVPEPRLWYPLGYGAQNMYTFVVKDQGSVVYSEDFGIRTAKIMQLPDAPGSKNHTLCLSIKNQRYDRNETFSGFVLKVNGEKIFCRGANWVPCVPYTVGNVDARQTEILELCAEAGVNMLRIWGGGAFETRHFYSECSRLGIMVTQDFLMACGEYPEEENWFISELQKEAYYVSHLCRNQPCLMWWTGDNENAVNGCDTDENYCGRSSAYQGIAPVLYREDPYRRFLPSSPYGGTLYASNTVGTTHHTQYLGPLLQYILGDDLSGYKEELLKYRARFIAEEPQLGAISLTSLRRFMSDEDIYNSEEMWRYHTKNNPGLETELFDYMVQMAEKVLGQFRDPQDKLFKMRYIQYEWLRVVVEQARREREFCSGIIFWMMNDCWPAASGWALIDYYNLPKDAFYAFKRCAKPVIASVVREKNTFRAYLINDGAEKDVKVSIKILSADRKRVKEYTQFSVSARKSSSDVVFEGEALLQDKEALLCDIEGASFCARAFYQDGRLELSPVEIDYAIDESAKTVRISAKEKYVHAVTVSGNAIFDDNCFSLLPYESRVISYRQLETDAHKSFAIEAYTLA